MRSMRGATVVAVLGLLMAGPAAAQDADRLEDGRWLPYLGCWVDGDSGVGPLTCVVPEGQGVAVLTVVDGDVTDRRVMRADGVERPVEAAGCTGVEAARFSSDGHRLYTEAELSCAGDVGQRTRGLIAMVDRDAWVEIRSMGVGDRSVAWVKRYAAAPPSRVAAAGLADELGTGPSRAVEAARMAASARITVDEVIEAHARTDAEAVRSWIAEQGQPLRLDADRLVELADAGVPAEVIDVAVAVSFPERFTVGRQGPEGEEMDRYGYGYGRYGSWGTWGVWSPWSPYFYDPYFYSPYTYGYNRWGYGGYYGSGFYSYRPTVIVVEPSTPSPEGRAVNGRGYTRSGTASSGTATRGSIRPSTPASSRVGSGYTGGSSSSSGGSKGKAKPRGGG